MLKDKVAEIIDTHIRPGLQMDGGDISLVDVDEDEGIVKVTLQGACGSCPMAAMTLQFGVEATLKKHLPQVQKVVPV